MPDPDVEQVRAPRPLSWLLAPYAATLIALGIGSAAVGATLGPRATVPWPAVPGFLALLAATAWLVLNFRSDSETMALDLFEALLAPAIFVLPIPVVVALAGTARAISEILHRVPALKSSFNIGQWMCATSAGAFTFQAIRLGSGPTPRNIAALALAMAVVAIVNMVAFSLVLRLAQGQPFRRVARLHAPMILLGWVINTSFGLLFAAAFLWTAWSLPLFVVPLLMLHRTYQAHAVALADKARLAGLHRTTQTLASALDPRDAVPRFLDEVRECFAAEVVELMLLQEGGRIVYRAEARNGTSRRIETGEVRTLAAELLRGARAIRVTRGHRDPAIGSFLSREGWRDCLAAPLISQGAPIGMLCAYNRNGFEGFEDGELTVLEAIASEAAAMIQKGQLLATIIEERRKLSEIVELTSDGIVTIGIDGTILTWNPGMEEISGYSSEEMVGSRLLGGLRPRDESGADVLLERWADHDEVPPRELQIVRRYGGARWLSCTFTRALDHEGLPRLLIVLARDVTKLREIEMLKEDFVATVSHELRTPLTPIKGWATTLIDHEDQLDPEQRRVAAGSILRQAETLERLITNLLHVAQIERGTDVGGGGIADAKRAARKVVNECRAGRPEQPITLDAPALRYAAHGDELLVERIIWNLVSNAMKYAPSREPIVVRVRQERSAVTVQVIDKGPGIPVHERDRIFARFQRLGDHMTRSESGAGLGLYIAQQLTQSIGGALTVESEPGHGATFTLRLRPAHRLVAIG